MIEKIIFKNKNEKEITLKKISIFHSKGSNQAGKTTVLESITSFFLFNQKYSNSQLIFS